MTMNGTNLDKLLAKLEQYEAAEEEAHVDRLVELRVRLELARRAEASGAGLRRSRMTAAEKSRWIRSRGKPWYDALPW